MSAWLPALICLSDFGGNWDRYQQGLYEVFRRDFLEARLYFRGLPLRLKRHPLADGKEATFWHFTSEGHVEAERTPDLRRCERIAWPRPIIERADDPAVKVWENERRGERRVCLWVEEADYLVVLAPRDGYVLPWTAYLISEEHRRRKLRREYEAYWNAPKS